VPRSSRLSDERKTRFRKFEFKFVKNRRAEVSDRSVKMILYLRRLVSRVNNSRELSFRKAMESLRPRLLYNQVVSFGENGEQR